MEKRLINYFLDLVRIDSESKNELAVAEKLKLDLEALGARVQFDHAHEHTGGNVGNIIATFPGDVQKPPLLFCAHMDTVRPGNGVNPKIRGGRIYSDGSTVLGSDDKAGIAEIVEAIRRLQEDGIAYAPIEVLFTISEEIGLLGAKNLDYSLLTAKMGYALDGATLGSIGYQAPALNILKITIKGKESHAGVAPERGINAIRIAADAISQLQLGRIDHETTANIGIINGGNAHNVVPNTVVVEGEVRSHDLRKLEQVTHTIVTAFTTAAEHASIIVDGTKFTGSVTTEISRDFPILKLDADEEVVKLAISAAKESNLIPELEIGGGGSDANVFYENGMRVPILGAGMTNCHSLEESIAIEDLEKATHWIMSIIKEYSKK